MQGDRHGHQLGCVLAGEEGELTHGLKEDAQL
jgi:hypothetical protein